MTTITSITVVSEPFVPPGKPDLTYFAEVMHGPRPKLYSISAASMGRVATAIWSLQCRGKASVRPFLAADLGYVATIGEGLR